MKRTHEGITRESRLTNARTWAAVGLTGTLALSGCQNHAQERAVNDVKVPGASASASPWEAARRVILPLVDCSYGAKVKPAAVFEGSYVAVDGRCNPPRPNDPVGVYHEPKQDAPAPRRVYNGQVVRMECKESGQTIGDKRGESSDLWLKVLVPAGTGDNGAGTGNTVSAQQAFEGFVPAANLNWPPTGNVPEC